MLRRRASVSRPLCGVFGSIVVAASACFCCSVSAEANPRINTTDHTEYNWQMIRHMYSGWVELRKGRLHNVRLPGKHFRALVLAARTKRFGRRPRKDNSLRNAIGNWLYSREYGAWRNSNRSKPYQGRNKELWESFVTATQDYSLRKAVG